MSDDAGLEFFFAEKTDIGKRRRNNQDSMGSAIASDGARFFCVADGIGGFKAGDIASQAAVKAACEIWEMAGGRLKDRMFQSLEAANDAVNEEAMERGLLGNMGTTIVMLGILGGEARVAYAGDSRVYRLRAGKLERLTIDHTDAQSLVTAGKIKPEEADTHKLRNLLTRYMGASISIEPTISKALPIAEDDLFMLCSDGLTTTTKDRLLQRILLHTNVQLAAETLIENANDKGGPDNITVQVVRYGKQDVPLKELSKGVLTELQPEPWQVGRMAPIVLAAAVIAGLAWWLVTG